MLVLPAVGVERLLEIPVGIRQADSHHRNAQIGRRLEVVARQDAQAAGVDRQGFMQSELGGEIGNRESPQRPGVPCAPNLAGLQIGVELVKGLGQPVAHPRIAVRILHRLIGQPLEELHRIVIHLAPKLRLDVAKHTDELGMPGPIEILAQLTQFVGNGHNGLLIVDFRLLIPLQDRTSKITPQESDFIHGSSLVSAPLRPDANFSHPARRDVRFAPRSLGPVARSVHAWVPRLMPAAFPLIARLLPWHPRAFGPCFGCLARTFLRHKTAPLRKSP